MTCSISNFQTVKHGTVTDMLLFDLVFFTVPFIMTTPSHLSCSVPWGLTAPIQSSRESMRWVHLTLQVSPG